MLNTRQRQKLDPRIKWRRSSIIHSEILISAGPRKTSSDDTELGEDVAGVVSTPNRTFFWLLDGTSESGSIAGKNDKEEVSHIFSSRLLAQDLSYFIQNNCNKERLGALILSGVELIKSKWLEEIRRLPDPKKDELREFLARGLNIRCSSTVIVGHFSSDGNLHYLNYGDSNVISPGISGDSSLTEDNSSASRIILQLIIQQGEFEIVSNNLNDLVNHTHFKRGVSVAYVFSDGVGKLMQSRLKSSMGKNEKLVRAVMARAPHKTYDDKSLIILKRKQISK